MSAQPTKKMLCLSVDDRGAEPSIEFEIGPYYAYRHRWVASIKELEIFDKEILLRDSEFKKDLAFKTTLHLFESKCVTLIKNKPCLMMIYPHMKGNQTIIAIGVQVPFKKPARESCMTLPLNTFDRKLLINDRDFQLTLAETILKHLPISEELCYVEDTEKHYYLRPE